MPSIYTASASATNSLEQWVQTTGVTYTWTGFADEPDDIVPRKPIRKSNLSFLAEAERSMRGKLK